MHAPPSKSFIRSLHLRPIPYPLQSSLHQVVLPDIQSGILMLKHSAIAVSSVLSPLLFFSCSSNTSYIRYICATYLFNASSSFTSLQCRYQFVYSVMGPRVETRNKTHLSKSTSL